MNKLINYMAAAKLARILTEPVLIDNDVLLPDGTFIEAGTDMDDLEPHILNAYELLQTQVQWKLVFNGGE